MNTRVERLAPAKRSRKRKTFFRAILLIFVLAIGATVLIVATPQGNTLMHKVSPTTNTPMDNIVKKKLTEKVDSSNLPDKDKAKIKEMAKDVPMSDVAKAAESPASAATLYAQYTGKDKASARDAIEVIYADNRLQGLRENVAKSNWVGALKDYNQLQANGTLKDIVDQASEKAANSAKNAQQSASKEYNDAVKNDSATDILE